MKKLAIAAAAAAAVTAGVAHAYTLGKFSNGFVVPNVIHYGDNNNTAIGIINASNQPQAVFWTFFDQDSNHITDSCLLLTANDYQGFIWNPDTSGNGLVGKRGYLVFAAGGISSTAAATSCDVTEPVLFDNGKIFGHAFQVNIQAQDVEYLPVIDGGLTLTPTNANLRNLNPDSLQDVAGAADENDTLYMRYYIDGAAGGRDTRIAVWSIGDQSGTSTVLMYNDKQQSKSVNFELAHKELDFIDPETIVGRPNDYTDGFIVWNTTGLLEQQTGDGAIFSYSVVSDPAFGAVQTILNPTK